MRNRADNRWERNMPGHRPTVLKNGLNISINGSVLRLDFVQPLGDEQLDKVTDGLPGRVSEVVEVRVVSGSSDSATFDLDESVAGYTREQLSQLRQRILRVARELLASSS